MSGLRSLVERFQVFAQRIELQVNEIFLVLRHLRSDGGGAQRSNAVHCSDVELGPIPMDLLQLREGRERERERDKEE